jgi:hypothetical protein
LLALRPGDLAAISELANLILEGRDAAKIADTLAWILSQPEPTSSLADLGARVLGRLADLDSERAVVFARRALEVLGVRHELLREALLLTAERANNAALSATVLERWLGSGASQADRAEIYFRLSKAYRAIGDRDAEAHSIVRALDEGARREDLVQAVKELATATLSAEGELSCLCARVLVADDESRTEACRDYAAALFDLAGDLRGSARVLVDAGDDGANTVRDAIELFGYEQALPLLEEFARATTKVETRASIAREAARAALASGNPKMAFGLAVEALAADPERAAPLEIAEASARAGTMWVELTELYDRVAAQALGRFGRRAAHFRGARFFEAEARRDLAVKHASMAFTAVPSDKMLDALARTSAAANDREGAARTVADVAESLRSPQARAVWLVRAAMIAPEDEDGLRQRVDLLLRAVVSSTERATFALLVDTAKKLLALAPDDRDVLAIRLERAANALGAKAEGPEGARLSLAFAELALEILNDAELAWRSVLRAIKLDGDIDEYDRLLPFVQTLAKDGEVAKAMRAALTEAEKPYSNVGVAALKLLGRVGELCEDHEVRARARHGGRARVGRRQLARGGARGRGDVAESGGARAPAEEGRRCANRRARAEQAPERRADEDRGAYPRGTLSCSGAGPRVDRRAAQLRANAGLPDRGGAACARSGTCTRARSPRGTGSGCGAHTLIDAILPAPGATQSRRRNHSARERDRAASQDARARRRASDLVADRVARSRVGRGHFALSDPASRLVASARVVRDRVVADAFGARRVRADRHDSRRGRAGPRAAARDRRTAHRRRAIRGARVGPRASRAARRRGRNRSRSSSRASLPIGRVA